MGEIRKIFEKSSDISSTLGDTPARVSSSCRVSKACAKWLNGTAISTVTIRVATNKINSGLFSQAAIPVPDSWDQISPIWRRRHAGTDHAFPQAATCLANLFKGNML